MYIGERRTAPGNFSIDAVDNVWGRVVSWEKGGNSLSLSLSLSLPV